MKMGTRSVIPLKRPTLVGQLMWQGTGHHPSGLRRIRITVRSARATLKRSGRVLVRYMIQGWVRVVEVAFVGRVLPDARGEYARRLVCRVIGW